MIDDIDAWWRSGDGGWDQVVWRARPAEERWLPAEMERAGLFAGDPSEEMKPLDWWAGFWD